MSVNLIDWLGDHAWAWWLTVVMLGLTVRVLTHSRGALLMTAAASVAAASGGVAMLGDRGVQIAVPAVGFLVAVAVLLPVLRPWREPGESPISLPGGHDEDSVDTAPRRAL